MFLESNQARAVSLSMKNSYTQFHKNPTNCLVVYSRSQEYDAFSISGAPRYLVQKALKLTEMNLSTVFPTAAISDQAITTRALPLQS